MLSSCVIGPVFAVLGGSSIRGIRRLDPQHLRDLTAVEAI
jgi:hypothetical protein